MSSSNPKKYEHDPTGQGVIEIVAGLVLTAISVALLLWIIPGNVGHSVSKHDISPDFFPKAAAWTLLLLSLALIVDRAIKTIDLRKSIAASSGGIAIIAELFAWLMTAAIAYTGIVFLSFHVTAIALIAAGALTCHFHKWRVLIAVAVLTPVLVGQITWLIFSVKFT